MVFTDTSCGGGDLGRGWCGVLGLDVDDRVMEGKSSAGSEGGKDSRDKLMR
ncbi:predicted protein [Sclerotinia sclerotiorum 1980 UF-70]|uniref:Uncharacterized protein n=1 Tax=Sclerotinia sclerotiorum (strain ATCC 18683 / 1980 / Ss-1) TaxID=665079 RepID=A7E9H7_SCLS1|nr:predicted protein [Sclerotinia sclerotiorum 1980 UF-70]EDN97029.1 predicted protein [Sclerotinia sclerotiorum 1980 UF-70]